MELMTRRKTKTATYLGKPASLITWGSERGGLRWSLRRFHDTGECDLRLIKGDRRQGDLQEYVRHDFWAMSLANAIEQTEQIIKEHVA